MNQMSTAYGGNARRRYILCVSVRARDAISTMRVKRRDVTNQVRIYSLKIKVPSTRSELS